MCLCRTTLHKQMIDAQEDRLCRILQTAYCILQTACILPLDTLPIATLHILFMHTAHICHKCIFLAIFALIYIHNAQCTQHSLRCIIYSAHRPYYVQCTMYNAHCSWYMDGKTNAWVPIQILSWNKWYTPWIDSQHNPTFSIPFNFIWDQTNHEVK